MQIPGLPAITGLQQGAVTTRRVISLANDRSKTSHPLQRPFDSAPLREHTGHPSLMTRLPRVISETVFPERSAAKSKDLSRRYRTCQQSPVSKQRRHDKTSNLLCQVPQQDESSPAETLRLRSGNTLATLRSREHGHAESRPNARPEQIETALSPFR